MADSPSAAPLVITDTDKRGVIVVVSVVTLSFLIVAFLTRIYVRLRVSGPWAYDDTTLSLATVFGIGQSIAVFLEVHAGFGRTKDDLSQDAIADIGEADYASSILYLIALCLSKCSVITLIMRLTTNSRHKLVAMINVGAAVFWSLSSVLLVTIKCSPAAPFANLAGTCSGLFSRWIYVCALDIFTEVSIFAMSIYLVANLHMSLKMKCTVVLAFALRLPVIAASAIRLYYLHQEVYASDPILTGYNAAVWTQVQVSYSLFATAAACLGPFIRPFTKPYLADTRYPSPGSHGASRPTGYRMSDMSGMKSNSKSSKSADNARTQNSGRSHHNDTHLRPGPITHQSHISSRHSVESQDSSRMIITKNMEWTVEYDGGESSSRRPGSDLTEESAQRAEP